MSNSGWFISINCVGWKKFSWRKPECGSAQWARNICQYLWSIIMLTSKLSLGKVERNKNV